MKVLLILIAMALQCAVAYSATVSEIILSKDCLSILSQKERVLDPLWSSKYGQFRQELLDALWKARKRIDQEHKPLPFISENDVIDKRILEVIPISRMNASITMMNESPSWTYNETIGSQFSVIDPLHSKDAHVLQFAGWNDMVKMVFDFPLAKHYHTVDCNASITDGFLEKVTNLAEGAEIEIQSKGFMNVMAIQSLVRGPGHLGPMFDRLFSGFEKSKEPFVIKARWKSRALGQIEKYFYFHNLLYTDPKHIEILLSQIPAKEKIAGAHEFFGASPDAAMQPVFERMEPGSSFIIGINRSTSFEGGEFREHFIGGMPKDWPFQIFGALDSEQYIHKDYALHIKRGRSQDANEALEESERSVIFKKPY